MASTSALLSKEFLLGGEQRGHWWSRFNAMLLCSGCEGDKR